MLIPLDLVSTMLFIESSCTIVNVLGTFSKLHQLYLSVYTSVFCSTGVALTADTKMHRNPSEGGVHSMALALPPSQAR